MRQIGHPKLALSGTGLWGLNQSGNIRFTK